MRENDLFVKRLEQEIEKWLDDGIITSEQKDKILRRYSTIRDREGREKPVSLISTLSIMGAVLVGAGVILFIASNWSGMSRWLKVMLIIVSMSLSYYGGFNLAFEKRSFPKTGRAFIIIGSFIFGAGMFLISQMYNFIIHYQNGFLVWGIIALLIAYLLKMKTLLSLAIIDLLIWLGLETDYHIQRREGIENLYIILYTMSGIVLWTSGLLHRNIDYLKKLSSPYIFAGLILTYGGLYTLTFESFWEMTLTNTIVLFFILLTIIFLLMSFLITLYSKNERFWITEIIILSLLMGVLLYLAISFPERFTSFYHLLTNLIFFFMVSGIIVLGHLRRIKSYVNAGMVFFIVFIFTKYFDYFWKMLPRSIFFIIGGLSFIGISVFLEKKRRDMIKNWEREGKSEN